MTKKGRRMWVRWFNRNFKRRPKITYYECNDGYFRRSRRNEMYGLLIDFAETYFCIHNKRPSLTIRNIGLFVK